MKNSHKSYNDIGISSELDIPRIIHLMKLGLIAAIMALTADLVLGYGSADTEADGIPASFARYLNVSDGRIFLSAIIGLIGIPLVCLCYFSIYRLIAPKSEKYAHMYRSGIIGCLTFGGGVHISCCALAYFMKKIYVLDPENTLQETLNFTGYFVLPITVLFMIFYIILIIAQIKAFAKGFTPLPKWAWIFSPLFGVIMAVILKLPNLPITNALATGWINLGNIWMFCGLIILTKKLQQK